MGTKNEIFVSVDVETSGPIPGKYSLLSIGACNVFDVSQTFVCEIKPTSKKFVPEALAVTGLSLERLQKSGLSPTKAMKKFASWSKSLVRDGESLVFVGFNAAFDWSFVNYYFHKYLGENPYGFSALDIKSLYMGAADSDWSDTRSSHIAATLKPKQLGDHQALHDAIYQAELFRLTRALARH